MEGIQPSNNNNNLAKVNGDEADDGDVERHFLKQLKEHYLENTGDDVLSSIVEKGQRL